MNIIAVDMNSTVTGGTVNVLAQRPETASALAQHVPSENFEASRENVRQMVEKMQEQIDSMNVSLRYSTYGEHDEKIAIAVVNKETGELIREIPSKELRNLYAKMSELAGMIFNREI